MSDVSIIKPGPEDWEKVRALRIRSVVEQPNAFGQNEEEAKSTPEEEWRERLAKQQYYCANVDSEIVAMVSAVPEKNEKSRHILNLYSMYVVPEFRRQGIGRKLLEALKEDVKQNMPDIVKLILFVSTTQPEAMSLYKSVGFKEVALHEKELFVNGQYIDEYEMVLFVTQA